MKTLNELVTEIHQYAKDKGWHDKPRSALEIHMLIVSELAEASEEVRNDKPDLYFEPDFTTNTLSKKPEGESVELADALIRICDYFGSKGWDLNDIVEKKLQYNKTRSYRHGNKRL